MGHMSVSVDVYWELQNVVRCHSEIGHSVPGRGANQGHVMWCWTDAFKSRYGVLIRRISYIASRTLRQ